MEHLSSHERRESEAFIEVSPDHEARKTTAMFKHAREALVGHYGCWIANGCDHDKPLEAHHFFVEWSKTGATDWHKMAEASTGGLLVNPQNGFNLATIDWEAVKQDPVAFVDGQANLMILCKKHHTDYVHGIHHIPYSLWVMQKYGVDGFEFTKAVSGR